MQKKKLRILIIDLIHNSTSRSLYRWIMFPNYISIMPQIIGVWCKEEGHEVRYAIFTGSQDLKYQLGEKTDLVFISSFTFTAQLAYALSNYFRSKGIVTVLGGSHARCYPEDSCNYFDYVMGLTDKELLKDLLHSFEMNKTGGIYLTATSQPDSIPGVRERWDFIEQIHRRFNFIRVIPMIGSFGCPYHCDFCIDAEIPYQTLDMEMIIEDLKFISNKVKHPVVSWYDPNFAIKFNPIVETIESVVPPGNFDFVAECSLSVLSETHVKRLQKIGLKMVMPGIESWFNYGDKLKMRSKVGMHRVKEVSEQVNMINSYIPHVQTNFVFGFDTDSGEEPFTLTKRFIDLAPGAYPSYALLSIFGKGARDIQKYEIDDRIIPFPFHMLMSVHMTNIIPKNYSWEQLFNQYIDLLKYSFSTKAIIRRFNASKMQKSKWLTLLLSLTIGGRGKIKYLESFLHRLKVDPAFRSFVRKETNTIPGFLIEKVKKDLGALWPWCPVESLSYITKVSSEQTVRANEIVG